MFFRHGMNHTPLFSQSNTFYDTLNMPDVFNIALSPNIDVLKENTDVPKVAMD